MEVPLWDDKGKEIVMHTLRATLQICMALAGSLLFCLFIPLLGWIGLLYLMTLGIRKCFRASA